MAVKTETKTTAAAKSNDKVMIIIPRPTNVIGDTETVVSVNGVMYQIQYDKPVEVPRNVAEVVMQSQRLQAKIEELTEQAILRPGKSAIAEL
ncbi:MAG: hypothetical protein ACI38A_07450 [Candidatus Ornithomonoglobus sp.]